MANGRQCAAIWRVRESAGLAKLLGLLLMAMLVTPLCLATGEEEKLREMVKAGLRMADPAAADRNPVMAAYFFFRAAAAGHAGALQELTHLAERGEPEAGFRLGLLYTAGKGVPQDFAAASGWWRMAAEQGHAEAQLGLGGLYRDGQGVPADPVQAYFWTKLAEVQGESGAIEVRARLARDMDKEQIAAAERNVREWQAARSTR